jgi:ABC-type thiamin/hydroxymethylpyrimidine transport system permease subunit
MGLKGFHVFFIVTAALLAIAFGAWGVWDFGRTGKGSTLVLAILGFAAAAALVVYGLWFLRKLKDVSST